jgi:hypothetical protein
VGAGAGAVTLAAALAFFAVLLWPSPTMSGEEERRLLEQARQASQRPRMPDVSGAVQAIRRIIAVIASATVAAATIQEMEDSVTTVVDAIEEAVRANPRAAMRCSRELLAFRNLTQQLLDILRNYGQPNVPPPAGTMRLWQQAVDALLRCLGIDPIFNV